MIQPTKVKPPQTPAEERVLQLEKELLKYKSLCEHLGATVMYDRLTEEEVFMLWVKWDCSYSPAIEGFSYFFNRSKDMWESFRLLEEV